MPTAFTKVLRSLTDRRVVERDRRLRAIGREVDSWTRELKQRVLGIVAADHGGREGVLGSLDALLIGAVQDAAELLQRNLRKLWRWAWKSATANFVRAVPMGYWLGRLMPVELLAISTEAEGDGGLPEVLEAFDPGLNAETEWERIIDGKVSEEEAREIVRRLEFGEPTPEQVDAILTATNAADGLSAMERIKTVLPEDLDILRGIVRSSLTAEFYGASAVGAIAKRIAPLLDTNEGINWKAKRIARTEGARIAEAAQRASWLPVADMLRGIRAFTAADERVRDEHRKWHGKLYQRTGADTYLNRDLGELPEFPAGPNCRCYTTAELRAELEREVPPVNWESLKAKTKKRRG